MAPHAAEAGGAVVLTRVAPAPRRAHVPARTIPRCRTRMPTSTRKPSPCELAGSAAVNATVARVAPAILELLADGVPRTKAVIVVALAGRHAAEDVTLALIRLAVTGRVSEAGGRYKLAAAGLWTGRAPRRGRCGRSWAPSRPQDTPSTAGGRIARPGASTAPWRGL